MPAWLVRISSICGGSGGALSPAAVALIISTTCACASASVSSPVAAAASPAVRSRWENATSASSCIGPGSAGASAFSAEPFVALSGSNGGTASAKPVGVVVNVVETIVNGRALTTSLSPILMVVGALKVCLAATMSIGRTSRSPLPGLTPSPSALSLCAARRIPAPRRMSIDDRGRDRAPSRSAPDRRGRPARRRRANAAKRRGARPPRSAIRRFRSAARGRVRRWSATARLASTNERFGRPKSSRSALSLAGKLRHSDNPAC